MDSKKELAPRLVIIEGNEKGKILTLRPGTQIVGRSKADIILSDARISRSHVSITFDAEKGTIQFSDLKSLNGTQINGQTQSLGSLKDGDQIQIGDTELDLQILEVAPEITAQKHLAEMLKKPTDMPLDIAPPSAGANTDAHDVQWVKPGSAYLRVAQKAVKMMVVTAVVLMVLMFFKRAPSTPPPELTERLRIVDDFMAREKMDEALAEAIGLSAQFPELVEPLLRVAEIYRRGEKWELAIGAFRKIHEMKSAPGIVHARLLKLYAQIEAKDAVSEELAHIDLLVGSGPYDRNTFVEFATVFLDLRDQIQQPLEKVFILAKALQKEIAPDDAIGFKLEARVMVQQGRFRDALEPLKKAMELSPRDEWPMENITFAYLKMGDAVAAGGVALEWIKRQPNSTKPLLVMAYLKVNQGNHLEGLPYAQRIIQMQRGKPDAIYAEAMALVGNIYSVLGQITEAKLALNESCNLGFAQACEEGKRLEITLRGASSTSENATTPAAPPTPTLSPSPESATSTPSTMPAIESRAVPSEVVTPTPTIAPKVEGPKDSP